MDPLRQALDDLNAYADSLDLNETLGELVHLVRFHQSVLREYPTHPGLADRIAAIGLCTFVFRLRKLAVTPIQEPDHGGLHSCELLSRVLVAAGRRGT